VANAIDDIIASISPMVKIDDFNCENILPFPSVIKKPTSASTIPRVCGLLSLSPKKNRARNKIVTVSSGPASRPSFEAPILLTESYHVKIPIARRIEAGIRNFHNLKTVTLLLFFAARNAKDDNNVAPAMGMLMAAMAKAGMLRLECNNSAIIDSKERTPACMNTIDEPFNKLIKVLL
jgi:hypothetical protein